mgnify:CR=1 FL=1
MDPSASDAPPAADQPARRLAPYLALGIGAVFAVLLVLLATASGQKNAESSATPLMGRTAPNIVGPTLGGGEFDLSAWRGRWMVLNFFTSTCVPCVQEHPELTEFATRQSGQDQGAQLVTLLFDDSASAVDDFFQTNGGGFWPVVLDDADASVDYGVSKVPETWVIDPSGTVVWRTIDTVTADGLEAQIQLLRREAGGG